MKHTLESAVNYLQFDDCNLDAAKQNEKLQDRSVQQEEEAYAGLTIYTNLLKQLLKMTNINSTNATFGGAQYNRMPMKQYGCHSTTPADKQIHD